MATKHDPLEDSNTEREARVEKLLARLRSDKAARAKQREKMKQCAEEVAKGTPADSAMFKARFDHATDEKTSEGITPDGEERLESCREQLRQQRSDQQAGLNRLKRTTMQAVETVRETTLLSPEELRERLREDDASDDSDDADALNSINGAT